MSKLEELIQELCPDGVEYIAISKCVNKISLNYSYLFYISAERHTV